MVESRINNQAHPDPGLLADRARKELDEFKELADRASQLDKRLQGTDEFLWYPLAAFLLLTIAFAACTFAHFFLEKQYIFSAWIMVACGWLFGVIQFGNVFGGVSSLPIYCWFRTHQVLLYLGLMLCSALAWLFASL